MLRYNLIGDNDYIFDPKGTILTNRGIDDIDSFLNLTDDVTHSYKLLKNIDKAVDCLLRHINNQSNVLLITDPDVDGYTSATILYQYLKGYDPTINLDWVLHDDKKHGIDGVEIPDNIDLLIVPDSGSNDFTQHKLLSEKGIDIIVLDHHEIEEESKHAIVVNSQLGNYPNLNLSGAGIVFKFCEALDDRLGLDNSNYFLDLVALGCIADSMSMKELETRYYVQQGLSEVNNEFFNALLKKQEFSTKGKVNITSINFYISPLINAVIRVGELQDKIDMFKSFLGVKELVEYTPRGENKPMMVSFVDDMARRCVNLRNKQGRNVDKVVKKIEEYIESNQLNNNKTIFISSISDIDEGTTGLIANKIASQYKKPTIILSKMNDKGFMKGSARGYDKSELKDFKNIVLQSDLFTYAKGHANAYGVEIHEDNFGKVDDVLNKLLSDYSFEDSYNVDFKIKSSSLSDSLICSICELEDLWGKNLEEPYILIKNIPVDDSQIDLLGANENTVRISFNGIKYMIFRTNIDEFNKMVNAKYIDVIGKANINLYKGKEIPQIYVDSYHCLL